MRTVDATPELIPFLLARMTAGELALLWNYSEGKPAHLVERLIATSAFTWCGVDAQGVVMMGGVIRVEGTTAGYVWQLATPAIADHKRAYIEQSRAMLDKACGLFSSLTTNIVADYPAALRHMRRLGFAVGEPHDLNGIPVCRCERASA